MQAELELTNAPSHEAGANQSDPTPTRGQKRRYLGAAVAIVLVLAVVSIDRTRGIKDSSAPSQAVMAAGIALQERLAEEERKKDLARAVETAKDSLKAYLLWTVFGSALSHDATASVLPEVLEASQMAWCRNEDEIKAATREPGILVLKELCPEGRATEGVQKLVPLARGGDINAATAIGFLQLEADPWESFSWADSSAAKGVPAAHFLLGYHYQLGNAVPKDTAQSVRWHLKAATHGDIRSQNSLCFIHQEFDDPKTVFVEPAYQSNVEAHAWCSLAASNPSYGAYADSYRRDAALNREKIARVLKPSQLAASMKRLKQLQATFKALRPD